LEEKRQAFQKLPIQEEVYDHKIAQRNFEVTTFGIAKKKLIQNI